MLGFAVSICRKPEATMASDEPFNDHGDKLLWWDSGGTEWLRQLARDGKAKRLKDNGYPTVYVGERDAVAEAAVREELEGTVGEDRLYLLAHEPRERLWLQTLDLADDPVGATREVVWGVDGLPPLQGLNCEGDLNWIEAMVEHGDAELLHESDEGKLYCGNRLKLTHGLFDSQLAATRNDEALVVTAWDLS